MRVLNHSVRADATPFPTAANYIDRDAGHPERSTQGPHAFTLLLGIGSFGVGCQSNKETLLMGDFFTGNSSLRTVRTSSPRFRAPTPSSRTATCSTSPAGRSVRCGPTPSHPGKERTEGRFHHGGRFLPRPSRQAARGAGHAREQIHFLKLNDDGTATVSKTPDAPSKPESGAGI